MLVLVFSLSIVSHYSPLGLHGVAAIALLCLFYKIGNYK